MATNPRLEKPFGRGCGMKIVAMISQIPLLLHNVPVTITLAVAVCIVAGAGTVTARIMGGG